MSSSRSKFLLDENVRIELAEFLNRTGVDAVRVPKGSKNGRIAALSLAEGRLVVTNDEDFSAFPAGTIRGVVWLRIAQDDPDALVRAFSRLLASGESLDGRFIALWPDRWEAAPLPTAVRPTEGE